MTRSVLLLMYFVFLSGASIGYYLAYRITTKYWHRKYKADLELMRNYINELPTNASYVNVNSNTKVRGTVSSKPRS